VELILTFWPTQSVIFATDPGFNTFAVLNMETGVGCGAVAGLPSSHLALAFCSQFITPFLEDKRYKLHFYLLVGS
jgi:hypothetical protein